MKGLGRNFKGTIYLLTINIGLAGCAGYTPRIGVEETPTGAEAYLYGHFFINDTEVGLFFNIYETIGLAYECEDGGRYIVRFSRDLPLQVIKIKPSTCHPKEIIHSNVDGMARSRKPVPEILTRPVLFSAGTAYYIGDFYAQLTKTLSHNTLYTHWRITDVKNNFGFTTKQFKAVFPKLAQLPNENQLTELEPR